MLYILLIELIFIYIYSEQWMVFPSCYHPIKKVDKRVILIWDLLDNFI